MRRIGFALAIVAVSTLPAYSQSYSSSLSFLERGLYLVKTIYQNGQAGLIIDGVWQPISIDACNAKAAEKTTENQTSIDSIVANIGPTFEKGVENFKDLQLRHGEDWDGRAAVEAEVNWCIGWSRGFAQPAIDAARQLANIAAAQGAESVRQWRLSCVVWAREYAQMREDEAQAAKAAARERELIGGSRSGTVGPYASQVTARERELIGGSRSGTVGPYASQKIPDSGGAGGSLAEAQGAQQQPPAVSSGGAGGSEPTIWGSQPAFDWKLGPEPSVVPTSGGAGGTEQIRIASVPPATQAKQDCDPKSFGNAQPNLLSQPKAKTEPKKRDKRVRAPTDADIARSNSGISPEAANAIGTIIGVGLGVGLNNIGRRGTYSAAPGRGSSPAAPRRGTFDAPLR